MGANVFANNMAISAKAGDGKLIAAFPDTCNSPPSPPTGPLPIPYPNSAFSRDLQKGTKRVQVGGKPVAVEDSYFKTSPLGNEAATKSFGGSLLTHTITGKAYFNGFSMDVTFEGRKVVRHLDLMTSNHASYPGGTPPFTEMEDLALLALEEDLCPCCFAKDCTAALSKEIAPGVQREALSFREFYNLDETDASGALTPRATQRQAELAANACLGGSCPNAGKPVQKSEPPCDVYRVLTKKEAERNFNGLDEKLERKIRISKGVPPTRDVFAQKTLGSAFAKKEMLLGKAHPDGGTWTYALMDKKITLDHTTPRGAGGCPKSTTNIEAHDKKCSKCKAADGMFDTWNSLELPERRAALGVP